VLLQRDFPDGHVINPDPAGALLQQLQEAVKALFFALCKQVYHAIAHVAHGAGDAELLCVLHAYPAEADALYLSLENHMISLFHDCTGSFCNHYIPTPCLPAVK